MLLTSLAVTGAALLAGAKVYQTKQKKGLVKLFKLQKSVSSFLTPSLRHQQLQTVSSANTATSTAEKTASLHLTISLSSLAIATTGALFYPPFTWLSVPCIIYIFIPRFKEVLRAIFIERKIKMVIVDGSIIMGLLLSGQVFACALTSTFMMLSRKLLVKVEDHSLGNVISLFGKKTDFVWLLTDGVEVRVPFDTLVRSAMVQPV